MKKQIGLFTAILFVVSTLLMACKAEVHTHTFAEEWKTDENFHWKECECGEIKFDAEHAFGEWEVIKEATEETEGSQERVCDVCKYKETEEIAKLEHTHKFATDWTKDETNHWHASTCGHEVTEGKTAHTFGDWTITKEPTEEAEGSREKSCTVCEYTVPEVIAKLEHTHKFASEWTYDETNHWHASTCGHEVTEGKTAHSFGDWITTKEATEEAEGSREKSCTVCGYTVREVIEKLEHTHKFATEWTKDETNHWHASTCGHEVTEGKTAHTFGGWITTKEATCTEEGNKTRTCEVCKKEVTEKIPAKGHNYSETWTSDEINHWHAATCGHEVTDSKAAHTFGDWTITKAATCTEEGTKTGTCKVCKKEVTEKIPAKGHSYSESLTKDASGHWYECDCRAKKDFVEHTYDIRKVLQEPTCTQEGKKTVYCTVCEYEKEETIPANGHTLGSWKNDDKNHWKECTECKEKLESAEHEYGWTVTKEPTETESGQMKRACKVCGGGESVTKELQPAPKGFRFVKGVTITGTESWTPESEVFVSGRTLAIPDLIVSDHEVTRGEYKAVMGSDPSWASAHDKDGNELEGDSVLNNPVNYVNWYDAIVYCNKRSLAEELTPCYTINSSTNPDDWEEVQQSKWDAATCNFDANGYRLPTEAEWEWLARGGENYKYAGSDNVDDVAWYEDTSWDEDTTNYTETRDVKTKAPNGYGLYDMSGNVHEWCWDWYDIIREISAADGATSGIYRVKRGGSWNDYECQVAHRSYNWPFYCGGYQGFRVVRASSN